MLPRLTALLMLFLFSSAALHSQTLTDSTLLQCIQAYDHNNAPIAGRESAAVEMLKKYFPAASIKQDRLGNLILVIGSGSPRRLLATSLDAPGYVISNIQPDGYCRITPIGRAKGAMTHQFMQGNPVVIQTLTGPQYAVAITPSAHFDHLRQHPESQKLVHSWQETILDLGCSSAAEVAARGIHLLDPVTTIRQPVIIKGPEVAGPTVTGPAIAGPAITGSAVTGPAVTSPAVTSPAIAGPAIRTNSAVIALATVAKTLLQSNIPGTVVIAFTTLDEINGKGWEVVQNKYGPFDQTIRFGHDIDLPATWPSTPVEKVMGSDIRKLIGDWLNTIDHREWHPASLPPLAASEPKNIFNEFTKEHELLNDLVSRYGVSGAEAPVRDYILKALPKWAHPTTDEKGNILVTVGKGAQHIAFVAHMDEVGYGVDSILDDGRLHLKQQGGFFNHVWEGHVAIVHTGDGNSRNNRDQREIPAIFEPRQDYLTATKQANGNNAPLVDAGFTTRQQALDAGIKEGATTVTMPKQLIRLTANKATARGFDDRVGCATLLLALKNIDPEKLPFKVTFVFSTGEETGLLGSTFAAKSLQDCRIVYPIDTYVSSDDPVEPHTFGYCPLGAGAVIRVIESVNIARTEDVGYLRRLAARHGIKTQIGMTAGGTDGQGFLPYDIPSVPLSWPGRYSHSPVEIMDFRDLHQLVALITTIMQDNTKKY
jgi:putative aminopeptidase FrvX